MHVSRPRLLLLGLTAALAVTLGFYSLQGRTALIIFRYGGYGLTLIAFVAFLCAVVRSHPLNSVQARLCLKGWKIAAIILFLTAFLHVQERHGFKVVLDEVALSSTAKRMYETREATLTYRGFQFGNDFITLEADPDKRPLLYPVLVSLLHDFTGYRIENTFILNGLLTPIFLVLLFITSRRVAGSEAGVAAMLIFSTIPLFAQTAAGGGFELLNLTMILLTMYLGMNFALRPTDQTLSAFCLSGVLLAQVRYESVLFVIPVALIIVWVWWRTQIVQIPWALIFTPLLLLGYPLQQKIMQINPALWQLNDRPSGHGVFSISYFYENVGRALNYFLSVDGSMGNSHIVFILGLCGTAFFWLNLYRQRSLSRKPAHLVFVVFMISLFVIAALLLSYFWGAFDDMLTTRLSLPVQLLMVLSFVWIWSELVSHPLRWRPIIAICFVYLFLWTAPRLQNRAYASVNIAAEEVNWLRHFMKEIPANSFVFDSNSTILWATGHVPANTLEGFYARVDGFIYHYNRKTFDNYFFVQRIGIENFEQEVWVPRNKLQEVPDGISIEPVKKIVFNPIYALQISRVTAVDGDVLKAWAEGERSKRSVRDLDSKKHIASSPASNAETNEEKEAYLNRWMERLP